MESAILVLPASLAGGVLGLLTAGNRQPGRHRESRLTQVAVLLMGTVAFLLATVLFGKVFGPGSVAFAVTATLLVAAWTGVLQTVWRLRLPASVFKVRPKEIALRRSRWTGVRPFGMLLRRTPLRHLGGAVYLSNCGGEARCVLRGLEAAEEVHVWSLVFCSPWVIAWCLKGWWWAVGSSLALHVVLNLYPILHIRLTRSRLEGWLNKGRGGGTSPNRCSLITQEPRVGSGRGIQGAGHCPNGQKGPGWASLVYATALEGLH